MVIVVITTNQQIQKTSQIHSPYPTTYLDTQRKKGINSFIRIHLLVYLQDSSRPTVIPFSVLEKRRTTRRHV